MSTPTRASIVGAIAAYDSADAMDQGLIDVVVTLVADVWEQGFVANTAEIIAGLYLGDSEREEALRLARDAARVRNPLRSPS